MKSHVYDFTGKDLLALICPSLVPIALFAIAMHVGVRAKLLPVPRPALDTDRTILLHQAEASRREHDADLVLIGDSSCLMDIDASRLGTSLPGEPAVLNLGTLSYLDPNGYATILRRYTAANPNRLRTVVLLMHPEALRRPSATEYHAEVLEHFYAGTDYCGPAASAVLCALGVEIFRGRVLSRVVPQPLGGAYGRAYGFTADLWNHLTAHHGSAFDPGRFNASSAQGNAEYRLAKQLEAASQTFRASVPAGVKLVVGITPAPQSFVASDYREVHAVMLETWRQWLRADAALTELPPTLPDRFFANTTHLNPAGARRYAAQLAGALAKRIPPEPSR